MERLHSIDAILSSGNRLYSDTLSINQTKDVIAIRKSGRDLGNDHRFSKLDQTRFATALSEIARNVINYANSGCCVFTLIEHGDMTYLIAQIQDKGPGIKDIEQALVDGFSTSKGLGLGLPGAKRLVHLFDIESVEGSTKVSLAISRPNR